MEACVTARWEQNDRQAPKPLPGPEALRLAADLVAENEDGAEIIAAMRADELFEAGNQDALAGWMEVLYAIDEIRRAGLSPDEVAH